MKRSRAGLILTSPEGFVIQQARRFKFKTTNNKAEYETLLVGIQLANNLEVKRLRACSDSQLVIRKILGEYEAREPRIAHYAPKVKNEVKKFDHFQLQRIVRVENTQADALSQLSIIDPTNIEGSVYLEIYPNRP